MATRPPVDLQVGPEIYERERSKWGKMAGAMREMMETKHGKDENPKSTTMRKFVTFAMRGFGNFNHVSAIGSYGDDLIASVKRCVDARGNTLISAGIRFPMTFRLLKAAVEVDFATINIGKDVEGSTTLADFPYWHKGKLERHRMGTEKMKFREDRCRRSYLNLRPPPSRKRSSSNYYMERSMTRIDCMRYLSLSSYIEITLIFIPWRL